MMSIVRSTNDALRISALRTLSPELKTVVAIGAYGAWTAITWLLEGRIQTLLRPDAVADRLLYTSVANVLVGTVLSLVLVREFVAAGFTTREQLGLRSLRRTLTAVIFAGLLGIGLYVFQQPPTADPIVVLNVFAQVLPVSIAELVVCWALVGGSVAALLRHHRLNPALADGIALVISAVLFGVYHFAHSPPFNTAEMVGILTIVGIGTGLIYFVGGAFYGALVFHNCMALFGIISSLAVSGQLNTYQEPRVALIATAIVSFVLLVAVERLFVRPPLSSDSGNSRG